MNKGEQPANGAGDKQPAGGEDDDQGLVDADCLIRFEDLRFGAEVAEGAYGKIFRGDYFGTEVAIKKFIESGYPEDDQKYIAREVATLKGIRHPNIVTFMGVCQHSSGIYIVTEWIPNGDLTNLLKDIEKPISWKERVQMMLDAAIAMRYLHGHNIIHRDLKSENLLLTENGRIKVCDLGFARTTKKLVRNMSVAGTELYMAPEVIVGEPYDEKCDIFGFGVVMFEVICRHPPPKRSAETNFGFPAGLLPQYMPDDCPADLALLTLECVSYNKEERPSFEVIFKKLKEIYDDLAAEESANKEVKSDAELARLRREKEEREKKEKEERERREREERERKDKEERERREKAGKERRERELRERREKQDRDKREKEDQDRRAKENKEREATMRSQIEREVRERLEQETKAIREKLELEYAQKEKEREGREKDEKERETKEDKEKEGGEKTPKERMGNGHVDIREDVVASSPKEKHSPKESPNSASFEKASPKTPKERTYPRSATTSGEIALISSLRSEHSSEHDAGSSSGDDSERRNGRVGKNAKKKLVKKKQPKMVSTLPAEDKPKAPDSPKEQRAKNNRSWGFRKGTSKAALVANEEKRSKSGEALVEEQLKAAADKNEKRLRRRTWAPIRGLFGNSEEDFAKALQKEEEKQKERDEKKEKGKQQSKEKEKQKDKPSKPKKTKTSSKNKSKDKDKVKKSDKKEKEKEKDKEKGKSATTKQSKRKSQPMRLTSTKSAENLFADQTKKSGNVPKNNSAASVQRSTTKKDSSSNNNDYPFG